MTKEHLAELIPHIESALEDGYPLQLKGDDLRFLLEAIKARLSLEPGAARPSAPLLSAFKCSACGKIADNSGDTVGWALCQCGSFRQPEKSGGGQ